MSLQDSLIETGVAPHAAAALVTAASRPHGMVVLCGPAGVGKTTIAQLIVLAQLRPIVHWCGDLRIPDELGAALAQAESASVVAVVRSGQSTMLRDRWLDMSIEPALIDRASVVAVTLRRLERVPMAKAPSPPSPRRPDLLVLEILGPDGIALTGSLADQARTLVAAGETTAEEARFKIPDWV